MRTVDRRLEAACVGLRASEWAAEQLRRVADRLDGGAGVESHSPAPGFSATSSS